MFISDLFNKAALPVVRRSCSGASDERANLREFESIERPPPFSIKSYEAKAVYFQQEGPRAVLSTCDVEAADSIRAGTAVQDTVLDGVLSPEAESNCCASVDEGLPPPMDEITLNNSHMNEDAAQEATTTPEEMRDSVEEESPEKQEKTPEEMARLKRQSVLARMVVGRAEAY
ncbi:hypothetical protein ANCCEY_03163 [Ancylostoma ceylanicum]|uniref:Uncharacterized protein n=1 Tax=Ancylostoma ceylanicum TaxID=53326 RepID=A0A0D6M0X7_9BILA|nr:hypothetical protein ANCCEY_03163 [Ancylostoma ceylanicum]